MSRLNAQSAWFFNKIAESWNKLLVLFFFGNVSLHIIDRFKCFQESSCPDGGRETRAHAKDEEDGTGDGGGFQDESAGKETEVAWFWGRCKSIKHIGSSLPKSFVSSDTEIFWRSVLLFLLFTAFFSLLWVEYDVLAVRLRRVCGLVVNARVCKSRAALSFFFFRALHLSSGSDSDASLRDSKSKC